MNWKAPLDIAVFTVLAAGAALSTTWRDIPTPVVIEGVLTDIDVEWCGHVVDLSFEDGREFRLKCRDTSCWARKMDWPSRVTVVDEYVTRIEPIL